MEFKPCYKCNSMCQVWHESKIVGQSGWRKCTTCKGRGVVGSKWDKQKFGPRNGRSIGKTEIDSAT